MRAPRVRPLLLSLLLVAGCGGGSGGGDGTGGPGGGGPPIEGFPDLGAGASLNGARPFPDDNPWNQRVDGAEVDPDSDAIVAGIGADTPLHPDFGANWDGGPFGIPYVVVSGSTPRVDVTFDYADESDAGPYPIPPGAPIEGGPDGDGDRHVLVVDRDDWTLYELFYAFPDGAGWTAGSGAVFDLGSNALRPAGWTSADAAGLPIFPGLARFDEVVEEGAIRHALRFTCSPTRRGYVAPARHFASTQTDPLLPPMGMRVRLKASFDLTGYPPTSRTILQALKEYGMILADNGGDWFISGAPDARWDDDDLSAIKQVRGGDLEVVRMGSVTTD
jgi:hypothetical protein